MSRVDVIVPCYNYGQFLPECIESILCQEVDVRVLILDDASADDTPHVAAELASRDPRVQWRRHSVNRGHIATYNEGLEWCSGSYTLLISADDLLTPGALARAVRFMDANPEVGFVYGRAIKLVTGQPLPACTVGAPGSERVENGQRWLEQVCHARENPIHSPELITRTGLQHALGGYRETLPHTADLEMWLRFAAHADVGILATDQAYYRVHGKNMHLKQFSASIDHLEQRYAAFKMAFTEQAARITQVSALQAVTFRNLAREAVWIAREALDQPAHGGPRTMRNAARTACRLAVEIDPSIRFQRIYWSYRFRAFRASFMSPNLQRAATGTRGTTPPSDLP